MVSITIFVAVLYRSITVPNRSSRTYPHQMAVRVDGAQPFLTGVQMTLAGTVAVVREPDGYPPDKASRQGRHK